MFGHKTVDQLKAPIIELGCKIEINILSICYLLKSYKSATLVDKVNNEKYKTLLLNIVSCLNLKKNAS